jgi:hypothetical protein
MVMAFVIHSTDFCLLRHWCKDTIHVSSEAILLDYVTFKIKLTIAAAYSVLNLSEKMFNQ